MSKAQDTVFRDEEFTGTARLFLVRDLVVFPNVVQALRVEQPRHCQLLADALASDSLITIATHTSGAGVTGNVSTAVCLARVISQRKHADGTAEILVLGLRRALITKPIPSTKPYREAQIELLAESTTSPRRAEQLCLRLAAWAQHALSGWPCGELLHKTMIEQRNLAVMTDLLGYWLPLTITQKLRLLRETRVQRRVAALIAYLRRLPKAGAGDAGAADGFPPAFSVN